MFRFVTESDAADDFLRSRAGTGCSIDDTEGMAMGFYDCVVIDSPIEVS